MAVLTSGNAESLAIFIVATREHWRISGAGVEATI